MALLYVKQNRQLKHKAKHVKQKQCNHTALLLRVKITVEHYTIVAAIDSDSGTMFETHARAREFRAARLVLVSLQLPVKFLFLMASRTWFVNADVTSQA